MTRALDDDQLGCAALAGVVGLGVSVLIMGLVLLAALATYVRRVRRAGVIGPG